MSNPDAKLEEQKKVTEQLRVEAHIQRQKVSNACADLVEYCRKNQAADPMLNGSLDNKNPFDEKRDCNLL